MNLNGKTHENQAHGLPNYYYTDPAIQARELKSVFQQAWQIVGRQEQLVNPGDYLTCTIGEEPLVVVRNQEGQLHAMHNVCAHRGMRLAEGCGNYKRLYCPYHGWTYDLDGQLRGVPYEKCLPGMDKASIRLRQAQVDTWGGFIFVNLDAQAPALRASLGVMTQRWEEYTAAWQDLREVKRYTYDEPFNWKIFMENATDYYHIPFIHQETLELPPLIENVACGPHFMLTPVTPEEQYRRFFDLIFPNMYFHVGPSKVQLFQVTPVVPDACHIDVILYQTPGQAEDYPINDPRKHRDIHQILHEDFAICRVLQQQAKASSFRILYTATDLEEGVDHFDKTVLAALHPVGPAAHQPIHANGIVHQH
jgi:phenylpropionate dioxygenase-like ring-hydroxylating dioxygenase large terminal subunit